MNEVFVHYAFDKMGLERGCPWVPTGLCIEKHIYPGFLVWSPGNGISLTFCASVTWKEVYLLSTAPSQEMYCHFCYHCPLVGGSNVFLSQLQVASLVDWLVCWGVCLDIWTRKFWGWRGARGRCALFSSKCKVEVLTCQSRFHLGEFACQ